MGPVMRSDYRELKGHSDGNGSRFSPTSFVPSCPSKRLWSELGWLRGFVAVGAGDSNGADVGALEGEDQVAPGRLAQRLIEWIAHAICVSLRRPLETPARSSDFGLPTSNASFLLCPRGLSLTRQNGSVQKRKANESHLSLIIL